MKNKTTPKESKNIILNKIQPKRLPFSPLHFKKEDQSPQSTLKTTPSTPFYKRKFSQKFKFNVSKINNQFNNNYELEQQNKNYYKKLFEIKNHTNSKKYSTNTLFNLHRKDGYVKLGIMNLAQQNLYMLKRLYEQKSQYSAKKMEKDYQKFQGYKKIMCKFPEIDFNKSKGILSDSYFIKSKKTEKDDKSEFLPTINYINDGSMIKIKKRILKDMKKNNSKIISPRNLKKVFMKENLSNNNININNKKEENTEVEYELDKGNIDNIEKK
jgi:hypothetical protein